MSVTPPVDGGIGHHLISHSRRLFARLIAHADARDRFSKGASYDATAKSRPVFVRPSRVHVYRAAGRDWSDCFHLRLAGVMRETPERGIGAGEMCEQPAPDRAGDLALLERQPR